MNYSPVILFVYNRPELTEATLRSLRANSLAEESTLHVFCDGPKPSADPAEIQKINDVRSIVRSEPWCREVHVHERRENLGLARSVIGGVSEILSVSDSVIVIEDDVQLSRFFLLYMNEALEKHKNDERVLSVGSWNYFCGPASLKNEHFYFRYPDSIAWATWAKSWRLFEQDAAAALRKLTERGLLQRLNGDGRALYFEKMLRDQSAGKIDSWAIRWTATSVLNGKLNVFPSVSMSKHMGFGGTATHEKSGVDYNKDLLVSEKRLTIDPGVPIEESAVAMNAWKKFVIRNFLPPRPSLAEQARLKAYRWLRAVRKLLRPDLSEAGKLIRKAAGIQRYTPHSFSYRNIQFTVSDFLSVAQQLKEYFEEQRLKFHVKDESPLIIDCGSNVGVSVLYFKSQFPGARIIAYEADPAIFALLKENIRKNNADNVTLYNKAVWTHDRGVEFNPDGADGGAISQGPNLTAVPSERLRDVILSHPSVDLLKIDIEGAEPEVITDCDDALRRVRHLFVEYHSFAGRPQRLQEILDVLKKNGFRYQIKNIGNQAPHPFLGVDAYNGMDMQLEIYAVRGEGS